MASLLLRHTRAARRATADHIGTDAAAHSRVPTRSPISISRGLDLAAPVLAAGWGLGRLLGPQLMVSGGGRLTTARYGMYYAGSVGRRVPVSHLPVDRVLRGVRCGVVHRAADARSTQWPTDSGGCGHLGDGTVLRPVLLARHPRSSRCRQGGGTRAQPGRLDDRGVPPRTSKGFGRPQEP